MKKICTIGVLAALVAVAGCNETRFKVVPVEGKITFADGSLLPQGTRLLFNPVEGGVGSAVAEVGAAGSFKVTHSGGGSGAEAGKYIVLLSPPKDEGNFYKVIPKDYYDGGVLAAEIREGMSPLEFKVLKSKKR